MKKITKSIIALSVLAGLASCAKEQTPVTPDDNDGMVELTLTATQENPETRTYVGETTTDEVSKKTITAILWTEGDRMSVFDNTLTNYEFTLSSGAGETSGTFTGKVAENATLAFAFYPYSTSMSMSSETGILSGAELKSEQTAKDGSFDPETALMMGMISNNSIDMGSFAGYVKVTPKFNCKKITLESKSSDDKLSGKLGIMIGGNTTVTDPSNKVSISGDIKADKAYYIAVLPVEMTSGFKLIFTMEDGTEKYREGTKTLKIRASKVKNLGEIKDTDLKVD